MSETRSGVRRRLFRHGTILLVLALLAPALLVACGDDDDDGASATANGDQSGGEASGELAWCGSDEVTLGIQDGGGLNAWSKASLAEAKAEAEKCDAIKKEIVVNAGFDPQKAISGLQGLISQGANAIVIIPDAGVCAELPAMRQATQRDVAVVPWAADGCGKVGTDYAAYIDWDAEAAGRAWAEWTFEQMGGKGKVLFLGGPAGNPVSAGHVRGILAAKEQYPDIEFVEDMSPESFPVSNWDPAEGRKVTASLLAKHPQIDGLIVDYGSVAESAIKAFQQAKRPVPPVATTEANFLACAWEKAKGTPDEFELATVSSRNWLARYAVQTAVAEASGGTPPTLKGNGIIDLGVYEDSTQEGKQPKCDDSLPPETYFSNDLPEEEQDAIALQG
jgi:ribose transport system substrate-binding protein